MHGLVSTFDDFDYFPPICSRSVLTTSLLTPIAWQLATGLTLTSSETHEATVSFVYHRAAERTSGNVLSTFFHIRKFTVTWDWILSLWLTGKRKCTTPPPKEYHQLCSLGVLIMDSFDSFEIWTHDFEASGWCRCLPLDGATLLSCVLLIKCTFTSGFKLRILSLEFSQVLLISFLLLVYLKHSWTCILNLELFFWTVICTEPLRSQGGYCLIKPDHSLKYWFDISWPQAKNLTDVNYVVVSRYPSKLWFVVIKAQFWHPDDTKTIPIQWQVSAVSW